MSDIAWIMATLDLPTRTYDAGAEFWRKVTGARFGEPVGSESEFVPLLPDAGAPHLLLQRVGDQVGGTHVDLHVRDRDAMVDRALALGATRVAESDWTVMTSPGGLPFCLVPASESEGPLSPRVPGVVDQVCLDVPWQGFDAELSFWSQLTGLEPAPASRPEFFGFPRPAGIPIRLILQRLDATSDGPVRAHVDLAAGVGITEVVSAHQAAGATLVAHGQLWIVMRDPAGRTYCISVRNPETGKL